QVILHILIGVLLYDGSSARNYDNYLARLEAESRAVHNQFLEENPRASYILDRLNSPDYISGHPILGEPDDPRNAVDDLKWRVFMKDLDVARKLAAQPSDSEEDFVSSFSHPMWAQQRSTRENMNSEDNLNGPEISSRRIEVAVQNPLWGEHKVSGGSSEIGQWLDYALLGAERQELPEEGSTDKLTDYVESGANHERSFKNDSLPAYCDPPNPCPIGYNPESLPTPCDPITKYTMEVNRDFILQKMANGECICDIEHMNSCSEGVNRPFTYSPLPNWVKSNTADNPYLQGPLRKRLVAKKSFGPKPLRRNAYLRGPILKTVVKKTGPYSQQA
ncbi:Neuroendocrine protein 7b2, partial [Fasciolopsis buskii]